MTDYPRLLAYSPPSSKWMIIVITLVVGSVLEPGYANGETATDSDDQVVEVAFATNRKQNGVDGLDHFYGNEVSSLSYGFCSVRFSPIKILKSVAQHIALRFPTEKEDIAALQQIEAEEFWISLQQSAAKEGKKILFYIHGYKMSFEKSCRRAALLQREVGKDVAVLLFAWPSQDNFAKYTQDETFLRKSVDDIKTVLDQMLSTIGYGQTHVVGHSLGTRGITAAIAELEGHNQHLFDELVLVAPDMDKLEFARDLPALARNTSAITMYVSENDGPLSVSREVHGEPRIGESGEYLTLFDGVETVDVTDAPQRDIYGHNYHYFNDRVISDLRQLLTAGTRASVRAGLKQNKLDASVYWEMTPLM